MSLDVVILAGGRGSRLAGIWDHPKCLVPIGEKPVLTHLIERVMPLRPRRICLSLGHQANEVIDVIELPLALRGDFCWSVEDPLLGTAGALRRCVAEWKLRAPLLVLNGDTLPGYQLMDLVTARSGDGSIVAWYYDRHAGAAVLGPRFLERLQTTSEADLAPLLANLPRCSVPGFLDVGTPVDFYHSQHLRGYP